MTCGPQLKENKTKDVTKIEIKNYNNISNQEFTTDFTQSIINSEEILCGGPKKDGIPAIDNPQFTNFEDAKK